MADAFTRPRPAPKMPLPERLAKKVPKLAREHEALLDRQATVVAREREVEAEIEAARRSDAQRARAAVAAGKPIPERTELALLDALDETRRERVAVEAVCGESSARLLTLAQGPAATLAPELGDEAARVESRAIAEVERAIASFGEAAALRGEGSWCAELADARNPASVRYRGTSAHSDGAQALTAALARIRAEAEAQRPRVRYQQAGGELLAEQAAQAQAS